MKYHEIINTSRRLRSRQTIHEKFLWSFLRKRKLCGKKFLRQHPIIYESKRNNHFFYIPDFYCAEEKLVIELDGPIHRKQKSRDEKRDLILKSKGLKIIRIKNEELADIDKVLVRIKEEFR